MATSTCDRPAATPAPSSSTTPSSASQPNVAGDAPGRHRPAGGRPRRHAEHQDPGRGARRRRQAVAPEGHRPGPPGLDPGAALDGRRRGPRPEAPLATSRRRPRRWCSWPCARPCPTGPPTARSSCVDDWGFGDTPSTKDGQGRARRPRPRGQGARRRRPTTTRPPRSSFRNLPDVHVLLAGELNAYDVLCSDWVVFTRATLPGADGRRAAPPSRAGAGRRRRRSEERRRDEGPPRRHHQARSCPRSPTRCSTRASTPSSSTPTPTRPRSARPSRRSSTCGSPR